MKYISNKSCSYKKMSIRKVNTERSTENLCDPKEKEDYVSKNSIPKTTAQNQTKEGVLPETKYLFRKTPMKLPQSILQQDKDGSEATFLKLVNLKKQNLKKCSESCSCYTRNSTDQHHDRKNKERKRRICNYYDKTCLGQWGTCSRVLLPLSERKVYEKQSKILKTIFKTKLSRSTPSRNAYNYNNNIICISNTKVNNVTICNGQGEYCKNQRKHCDTKSKVKPEVLQVIEKKLHSVVSTVNYSHDNDTSPQRVLTAYYNIQSKIKRARIDSGKIDLSVQQFKINTKSSNQNKKGYSVVAPLHDGKAEVTCSKANFKSVTMLFQNTKLSEDDDNRNSKRVINVVDCSKYAGIPEDAFQQQEKRVFYVWQNINSPVNYVKDFVPTSGMIENVKRSKKKSKQDETIARTRKNSKHSGEEPTRRVQQFVNNKQVSPVSLDKINRTSHEPTKCFPDLTVGAHAQNCSSENVYTFTRGLKSNMDSDSFANAFVDAKIISKTSKFNINDKDYPESVRKNLPPVFNWQMCDESSCKDNTRNSQKFYDKLIKLEPTVHKKKHSRMKRLMGQCLGPFHMFTKIKNNNEADSYPDTSTHTLANHKRNVYPESSHVKQKSAICSIVGDSGRTKPIINSNEISSKLNKSRKSNEDVTNANFKPEFSKSMKIKSASNSLLINKCKPGEICVFSRYESLPENKLNIINATNLKPSILLETFNDELCRITQKQDVYDINDTKNEYRYQINRNKPENCASVIEGLNIHDVLKYLTHCKKNHFQRKTKATKCLFGRSNTSRTSNISQCFYNLKSRSRRNEKQNQYNLSNHQKMDATIISCAHKADTWSNLTARDGKRPTFAQLSNKRGLRKQHYCKQDDSLRSPCELNTELPLHQKTGMIQHRTERRIDSKICSIPCNRESFIIRETRSVTSSLGEEKKKCICRHNFGKSKSKENMEKINVMTTSNNDGKINCRDFELNKCKPIICAPGKYDPIRRPKQIKRKIIRYRLRGSITDLSSQCSLVSSKCKRHRKWRSYHSNRQVIRTGSTLSRDAEFHENVTQATEDIHSTAALNKKVRKKPARRRRKTKYGGKEETFTPNYVVRKGARTRSNTRYGSQVARFINNQETGTLRECFCTVNLRKQGQNTFNSGIRINDQILRNPFFTSNVCIKLKPFKQEPGAYSSDKCVAHQCYKMVPTGQQMRKLHFSSICLRHKQIEGKNNGDADMYMNNSRKRKRSAYHFPDRSKNYNTELQSNTYTKFDWIPTTLKQCNVSSLKKNKHKKNNIVYNVHETKYFRKKCPSQNIKNNDYTKQYLNDLKSDLFCIYSSKFDSWSSATGMVPYLNKQFLTMAVKTVCTPDECDDFRDKMMKVCEMSKKMDKNKPKKTPEQIQRECIAANKKNCGIKPQKKTTKSKQSGADQLSDDDRKKNKTKDDYAESENSDMIQPSTAKKTKKGMQTGGPSGNRNQKPKQGVKKPGKVTKESKDSFVVQNKRFEPKNPFRQAVKVSSSFSFNLEFYKDRIPMELVKIRPIPVHPVLPPARIEIRPRRDLKATRTQAKGKGPCPCVLEPKATNTKCECHLKDAGTNTKPSKPKAPTKPKNVRANLPIQPAKKEVSVGTKKECNTAECFEKKLAKMKASGMMEHIEPEQEESTLVFMNKMKNCLENLRKYKFSANKQSVQYGTKFSFGCEFFKDRHNIPRTNSKEKSGRTQTNKPRTKTKKTSPSAKKPTKNKDRVVYTVHKTEYFRRRKHKYPTSYDYDGMKSPAQLSKVYAESFNVSPESKSSLYTDLRNGMIKETNSDRFKKFSRRNVFTVGRVQVENIPLSNLCGVDYNNCKYLSSTKLSNIVDNKLQRKLYKKGPENSKCLLGGLEVLYRFNQKKYNNVKRLKHGLSLKEKHLRENTLGKILKRNILEKILNKSVQGFLTTHRRRQKYRSKGISKPSLHKSSMIDKARQYKRTNYSDTVVRNASKHYLGVLKWPRRTSSNLKSKIARTPPGKYINKFKNYAQHRYLFERKHEQKYLPCQPLLAPKKKPTLYTTNCSYYQRKNSLNLNAENKKYNSPFQNNQWVMFAIPTKKRKGTIATETPKGAIESIATDTPKGAIESTATNTTKGATATKTTKGATATKTTKGAIATNATKGAIPTKKTKGATATETTKGAIATNATKGAIPTKKTKGATATETTKGAIATNVSRATIPDTPKDDCNYTGMNKPTFEKKVDIHIDTADMCILNKGELIKKLNEQYDNIELDKECCCCACSALKKKLLLKEQLIKKELADTSEAFPLPDYKFVKHTPLHIKLKDPEKVKNHLLYSKYVIKRPLCTCGSKICNSKLREEWGQQQIIIPPCSCGTKVCKEETLKAILKQQNLSKIDEINFTKLYDAQYREREKVHKIIRAKEEAGKRAKKIKERQKVYAKEDAIENKRLRKRDQIKAKQIKKETRFPFDRCTDSVADVAQYTFGALGRSIKCVRRFMQHPKDNVLAYRDQKCDSNEMPKKKKKGTKKGGTFLALLQRVITRMSYVIDLSAFGTSKQKSMQLEKIFKTERNKRKNNKFLRKRRNREKAEKYNACDPYLMTLRKKPCLWVLRSYPWFYPHCLQMLYMWKKFVQLLGILLAVVVWSPCLLCTEACRALLCCTTC